MDIETTRPGFPRRVPSSHAASGARRLGGLLVLAGALLAAGPALHVITRVRSQHVTIPPPVRSGRPPAVPGDVWGRLELPRVGLDLVVYEGVTPAALRQGPGHVPGTDCAGPRSNCVIAGHRDTFFRRLSKAREGDLVLLSAADGAVSSYRLGPRRIVRPEEVSVLLPSDDRRLTLITCYPFAWIGAAPYRLVWSAAPIEEAAAQK
jgi:sortase A